MQRAGHLRCNLRRRSAEAETQTDDGSSGAPWPDTDHVVIRHRRGCDEADRSADDRGNDFFSGARSDHDAGDIRNDEEEGVEEGEVEIFGDEALKF